jgi:hypothetical protein
MRIGVHLLECRLSRERLHRKTPKVSDECQQCEALHLNYRNCPLSTSTTITAASISFPSPSCFPLSLLYTAMSRQPSPGPSHFPPSAQHANNRQKSKNYTQGIAAGAEDAKYKTKYRELKKKVKEIETVSQPDAVFVYRSRLTHCHLIRTMTSCK